MKLILISALLLISSIAFASSCPQILDKKKPIGQDVSNSINVEEDGIEDKIVLHVQGKDFYSPFRWELKIYSKGKIIHLFQSVGITT